ncbi:MAG: response regulator, partial [Flavobacteriales bacterium]|nr:response regulator [Flavobacteriales bacterium]
IALVDDDIPNTEVLRDFLIRNGYSHVDKYHDGESFLDTLDRFDERAVVLDFDLSGGGDLNGLEVLEAVKERSPQTHVIFFSGQDSLEVAVESLKNGADDYIVKSNAAFALVKTSLDKVYDLQVLKTSERRNARISYALAIGWMLTLVGVALFVAN